MSKPADVLAKYRKWRVFNAQFQRLWTKAVGQTGYVRREWEEIEKLIEELARGGLGDPEGGPGNGAVGGNYGSSEDDPTVPFAKH